MQATSAKKKAAKEELGPDVKAAIAAVDAAVKKLPNFEIDLMSEEGFAEGGGAEVEPPNPGSKVDAGSQIGPSNCTCVQKLAISAVRHPYNDRNLDMTCRICNCHCSKS